MVKLFQSEHEFKHPWSHVTSAFWRKYPNDLSPHVKEVDTYSRYISPCGLLVSHRLMRCESSIPSWLSSFNVPTSAYAAETTIVDPKTQKMIIRSRNLTGSNVMIVEEECSYMPSMTNKNHTRYIQSASISAFLPMFSGKFEQYSYANMHIKSKLGLDTMETLCQNIKNEGLGVLVDQLHKLVDVDVNQVSDMIGLGKIGKQKI